MFKLDFEQRQRVKDLVDRIGDDLEEYAFQIVFLEYENRRLQAELDSLKTQEPVAWLYKLGPQRAIEFIRHPDDELAEGVDVVALYAAPKPEE